MIKRVATASIWAGLAACSGPRTPHPRYVSQPTAALEEVPYPAPPPLVEVIPDRPVKNAVWVDGEWRYSARQWRWTRGEWVVAPTDLAFSPPVAVRSADGTLYYAPGIWRDSKGVAVDDPDPLARARGGGVNTVMNPSGLREEVGRTRNTQPVGPPPATPKP